MEEQSVSFETAKLAKEKGFNYKCRGRIHCSHFHLIKDNVIPSNVSTNTNEMFAPIKDWNNAMHRDPNNEYGTLKGLYLSLPTQSLLQKWLREVHGVDIVIDVYIYPNGKRYIPMVYCVKFLENVENDINYESYEAALEAALLLSLQDEGITNSNV